MPNQLAQLYEGEKRVRDVLYKKRAVMQTYTGDWLGRQRSSARREVKTEASWGNFLEYKYR